MKKFFWTMLSGPDGDISAKRSTVFALLVSLVVYIFLPKANPAIVGSMLGAITLILGVQAVTRS